MGLHIATSGIIVMALVCVLFLIKKQKPAQKPNKDRNV